MNKLGDILLGGEGKKEVRANIIYGYKKTFIKNRKMD